MFLGGNVGNRIKTIRQEKGISQNRLAKAAGISQSGLSSIESSSASPSAATLELLAKALNVSVADLMGDVLSKGDKSTKLKIDDNDLKFALFGDPHNITDEQFEEVKRFARYVEEHYHKKD